MSISDDFIKEALGVSPKRKKTNSDQQSQKTAGSSIADDFIRMAHYDVDESFINTYLSDANRFMSSANDDYSKVGWGNASSSYKSRRDTWTDLNYRHGIVQGWLETNKDRLDENTYKEFSASLDSIRSGGSDIVGAFSEAKDFYSSFDTEDDYKNWQTRQEMAGLDLNAAQKEIEELERKRDEMQRANRQPANPYMYRNSTQETTPYGAALQNVSGADKELYALDAQISQKKAYLNQAKHIQEGIKLSSAIDNADFSQYSG